MADSEENDEFWQDSGEVGGVRAVSEDRVFPGGVSALGQRWSVHGDICVPAGGSRSQVCMGVPDHRCKTNRCVATALNTPLSTLCNLMSLIFRNVKKQTLYKTNINWFVFVVLNLALKGWNKLYLTLR